MTFNLPPSPTDDTYDEGEDVCEELEGLEKTAAGKFVLSLPIPPVFFKYIIGVGGATKTTIEKDTGCRITIPRKGMEGNIGEWGPEKWALKS